MACFYKGNQTLILNCSYIPWPTETLQDRLKLAVFQVKKEVLAWEQTIINNTKKRVQQKKRAHLHVSIVWTAEFLWHPRCTEILLKRSFKWLLATRTHTFHTELPSYSLRGSGDVYRCALNLPPPQPSRTLKLCSEGQLSAFLIVN